MFTVTLICTWLVVFCIAVIEVHYEFGDYSGIYASICPQRSCVLNSWRVDLHEWHLSVGMYEGAVVPLQYQAVVQPSEW